MSAHLLAHLVLAITQGDPVSPCGWPSAAAVFAGPAQCSGVLVHPQVAMLDHDCMEYFRVTPELEFVFGDRGEDDYSYSVSVSTENCGFLDDAGYCTFDEPLPIPVAPVAAGCEQQLLVEGAPVTLVGYGTYERGALSIEKRSGKAVVSVVGNSIFYVEGEQTPCNGDSGSPAFLEMPDGTWRTVGIVVAASCESPSIYANAIDLAEWIEAETGFDLTPCHDDTGAPTPDAETCGGFVTGGEDPGADWTDFCAGIPLGGTGGVCNDAEPPTVTIVAPSDGAELGAGPVSIEIEIEAEDPGTGVREVALEIDGEVLPSIDTEPPFVFPVQLPDGEWTVAAHAYDWNANEGVSDPITLYVGQVPTGEETDDGEANSDGPSGTTSSTGAIPEDESGSSDDGEMAAEAVTSRGCACATSPRRSPGPSLLLLAIVGFALPRRHRSARALQRRRHESRR